MENYTAIRVNYTDELYHYGVKGMKWGVRRDARILANSRRNKAVRKIKDDYDRGRISTEKKKSLIRSENTKKKDYLENTKTTLKGLKSEKEVDRVRSNVTKQLISEVPNYKVKRGLATANMVMEAIGQTTVAAVGVTSIAANPAIAPVMIPAMGIDIATNRGRRYIADKIVDKIS